MDDLHPDDPAENEPSEGQPEEPQPCEIPPEEAIVISADMLQAQPPRDTRVDFDRGISYTPRITFTILAVTVGIFIWQVASGALASKESIIAAGALYRPAILDGEVWRLVTAIFLHANFGHLFGNCLMLYILGMACEHAFGGRQFILLYFVAGIGGSVLSVLVHPGPSVGASGAIFGLAGAIIVIIYRYQKLLIFRNKRVGIALLVWAIYAIVSGFATPYIDNFCHIGGFVAGAATTFRLRMVLLPATEDQQGTVASFPDARL